jgi:CMP-N-acetylneuraminic acid synthetase
MSESSYKTLEILNGSLTPLALLGDAEIDSNAPRQSFPDTYQANGYVDVLDVKFIMENQEIHGKKILPFITEPAYEVDSIDDFEYLEYLASKSQELIKKLF